MNNNTKENDWFLNVASNPTFSITNFRDVGLDASNTSLADENTYKNIPQIQEHPEFQTDGKFDETKFHTAYQVAAETYNRLADETYQEDIIKQASFHRDNIFAAPTQRRKGPDVQLFKEANPLRQKRGIRRLNLLDNPTQSIDEIAQTQKVWDGATKTWHDSPNDSFWTDFWDTRVMAQWDFDADKDGNPTKDESKIVYKKGDLKLNENGTYYYENLNGRSVYGRRVLSKLNTLTTDGSAANKYDFFDSDDLEKSTGGTFMKNVAMIAPMFIPYVGPWYIGAGIAMEVAKVGSVLGKMFTGSDNKFLSAVEGFTQSLEPTSSQYAQDHAWALENIINLTSDVFRQLYEQRWLFKYAPAMFKGGTGISEKAQNTQVAKWAEGYRQTKIKDLLAYKKTRPDEYAKAVGELSAVGTIKAQARLESYMKEYNKLGSLMSKAYMTGITVQNAYGEAKQQGASDMEAALLTLGYAAGEYAIINSRLGEWILPELRMEKEQWKQVAKTLVQAGQKELKNTPKEQKVQFMKKLFNMGKDIAQANYSVGKTGLKATAANALGEGVEEVSEELLYDFAKSVSNLGSWLSGSDTNLTAWDDMTNRYGLSFVGGAIGGGVFQAVPDFKEARKLKKMKDTEAYQQLVYMARNGQMNDFLKTADKMVLGNKYLSATKQITNSDGEIVWAQGTDNDNQDLAAKGELRRQAKMIDSILRANGANISDDSFLDIQTMKDLRFAALTKSSVTARYLQDFNSLCADIIDYTDQLNSINSTVSRMEKGITDKSEKENGEDPANQAERSRLEALLKEALEKKDSYLNGDRAPEYIKEALFEMSPAMNDAFFASTFIRYAEAKTGRKIHDIPANELERIRTEYKDYADTNRKDQVHQAFMMFNTMNEQTSQMFADHSTKYYESMDDVTNQSINVLQKSINATLSQLLNSKDSEDFVSQTTSFLSAKGYSGAVSLISTLGSESDVSSWNEIVNQPITEEYGEASKNSDLARFLGDFVYVKLSDIVQPIVNQGFVNPEVRNVLLDTLDKADAMFFEMEQMAYDNDADAVNFALAQSKIQDAKKQLSKLPNSPITEILDGFALSITDSDVKVSKLLADLENQLANKLEDVSSFDISNDIGSQIKEALKVIEAAKSIILAARTDSADLDNLYGYNATVNELRPEVQVAEIQSPIADAMLQDIETLQHRLEFFQKLNSVNNEQKLNEQSKTAINKDVILYRKLSNFILAIPDNWNGKLEFKATIDGLTTLKGLDSTGKRSLTAEEKVAVETERIAAEDAIYNFFQANSDRVKDPKELSNIISSKNFNIYSNNDDILESTSTDIDDNAFIWYLATRAAVKSTDFYNQYKTIISDEIAPIPTQELATYLGYTAIVNGSVIDSFVDAVNQSIKTDWETLSPEEKKTISYKIDPVLNWDFALDSSIAPRFSRVAFIEGIPGSGKTTGVYKTIVTLLKKYHPDTLKNVWVGHATQDSAEKLASSLKLDEAKSTPMDKEKFMRKISSQWSESQDEHGNIKITDNMFVIDDENILRSSFDINEVSSAPSLILIDEVSRYTTFDLDLIERFAKKYGVPVIVAGDFDQTRAVGKHKVTWKGQEATNYVQLYRNNFVRTPKLGVSMRTNNSQKSFNLKVVRALLPLLRKNGISDVRFHYFQDEGGLYGDKVYNQSNYDLSLIKADIDLMLSTLEEGQKIGYIFSDTTTDLYKMLSDATYKDKISWHEGNSAQGLEGQYYIIEPDINAQPEQYWSDLYTGITRAMQGSIVVHNGEYNVMTTYYDSIADTSTNREELSNDQVKKYSEDRRKLLEQVVPTGEPIKVIPRGQDESIVTLPPEVEEEGGLESTIVETTNEEGEPETVVVTNNGLEREEDLREKIVISSASTTPAPAPVIVPTVTSKGTIESLETILYSFNTFETGWIHDKDGKLVPGPKADARIDSFNGLSKLNSLPDTSKTPEEMATIMGYLRSTVFNTKDKAELLSRIKSILNIDTDIYGTFAYKSSAGVTNDPRYDKFAKSPEENLEYIFADDYKSASVNKKSLVLIVGQTVNGNSSDILEIPLVRFPSPLTMMKAKGFEGIRSAYRAIEIDNPSLSIHRKLETLLATLKTSTDIQGADVFSKFIEVYNFTQNGVFFVEDPSWTLAGNFASQGPVIINRSKGNDYEADGYKFDSKWIELSELSEIPGRYVSNVMISPRGTYTHGDSKVINIAKPGQPFVLVTDDISLKGEALKNYYYNQLVDSSIEKKVKLVYVAPPKASFKDYFDNLKAIITKDGTPKSIGNDFTAYRMLNILMHQPEFEKSEMNYLDKSYNEILGLVERLARTSDVAEQMKILKEPVDIKGMNANIDVQQALQNYLFRIVYPGKFGGGVVFKPENLASIEYILGQNGIDGIFYNVRYDRNSKDTTMVDAKVTGQYTIDGIPFMVNGKIDPPTFYGSVDTLLDTVINKVVEHKAGKASKDNQVYMRGSSNITVPTMSNLDVILSTPGLIMDSSVRTEVIHTLGDKAYVTQSEVMDFLKGSGHIVLDINGMQYVSQRNVLFDGTNASISNLTPISMNLYKFVITLGSETYNAEFDLQSREASLVKVSNTPVTPIQTEVGTITLVDDAELATYLGALRPISIGHAKFKALKSAASLAEFNSAVNDLPSSQMILKKITQEMDNFESGPQREALQSIADLLQAKLDMKKSVEQTDESCPVVIKINF